MFADPFKVHHRARNRLSFRAIRSGMLAAAFSLTASMPLAVPASAHDTKAGALHIEHPWTRATPGKAPVAGGYMTIENNGSADDRLTGGSTPIAGKVEVHQMTMDGGVMKMRRLEDGLVIPAGQSVTLDPGGFHLMLIDPTRPLKEGERVPLTLNFQKAGAVKVELAVESMGAKTPGDGGHHHDADAGKPSGGKTGEMDMSGMDAGGDNGADATGTTVR